jgi:hypothetical protein
MDNLCPLKFWKIEKGNKTQTHFIKYTLYIVEEEQPQQQLEERKSIGFENKNLSSPPFLFEHKTLSL